MQRAVQGLLIAVVVAVAACMALPAIASAGQWVQVSCVNPDGSASTNQGWTPSSDNAEDGSSDTVNCSPSSPMTAYLSSDAPAPVSAYELLTYTPPAGSTLAGGTIAISGTASAGGSASGTSDVYSPAFVYPGDVIYQCAQSLGPCQGNDDYTTTLTLPSDQGGGLYLAASCGGGANTTCSTNPQNGTWSQISLSSADLLLSNASTPAASGFSGTLLSSPTQGANTSLLFTATDPSGPGVYSVNVEIDGTSVYNGVPNTNGGACASVGTYSGTSAMEFDYAQPCLQTESVNIPVSTSGLSAGQHELTVTVADAAGNTATVDDQYITITGTATASVTPTPAASPAPSTPTKSSKSKPLSLVKVHFLLRTRYTGAVTRLLKTSILKLPKNATLEASDSGPKRPKLKLTKEPAKRAGTLYRSLEKARFHAGDTLVVTVIVPHKKAERLALVFRNGKQPTAKLYWGLTKTKTKTKAKTR